jgi:soluble lytic murein transglycosylase-like protein
VLRTIRTSLAAAATALLAVGLATVAQAAEPELALVERPAERFERSIRNHVLEVRYRDALATAERLHVAPRENALAEGGRTATELRDGIDALRERIEEAREQPDFGLAPGVSAATLEAIAACESGGDPTAVNAAGYYGKYQFDLGTWAAVGGSGNPARAPEAEQDYRASLLYSRAGSSPWPVCGA